MRLLRIRERTDADLPACARALHDVHLRDRYPMRWPGDPQAWLSPPELVVAWVAEYPGDGIVGHVALTRPGDDQGDGERDALVSRLFVAPEGRRQQTGTKLLDQARDWAAVQGLALMLEVAELDDGAALALYERRGWVHLHTRTATWTTGGGAPVSLRYYRPPR